MSIYPAKKKKYLNEHCNNIFKQNKIHAQHIKFYPAHNCHYIEHAYDSNVKTLSVPFCSILQNNFHAL